MKNEQLLEALRPENFGETPWSRLPARRAAPRVPSSSSLVPNFVKPPSARFCVVVPTYNERSNIDRLVALVDDALGDIDWEMIIVDDNSPDGTADHARALHADNPRVRVIRRLGRRGLASACVEGMLATSAPYIAVMDGDLQHDPRVLLRMFELLEGGDTDLVAASRYVPGGSIGDWNEGRAATSRIATRFAYAFSAITLSDPMSGFFAVRRQVIDRCAPDLSAIGFKILLDIAITAGPGLRIREVPLRFACREEGVSKLSVSVAWDYAMMLADKLIGHLIPIRLVAFGAVAVPIVAVHLLSLSTLFRWSNLSMVGAQLAATAISLVTSYAAQNLLACRGGPRRGWRWFRGLAGFSAASAIGVASGVFAASALIEYAVGWPLAGMVGITVSLVWNYGAASQYAWCAA